MNARVKSILLLAGTLLVGALLGMFATSTWQHRRMQELRQVRELGGMMRILDHAIEIENPDQQQEVEQILKRAETSFRSLRRAYTDSMIVHREALFDELRETMTPEQIESVEKWLTRERRSHPNRGRRNNHNKTHRQRR